MNFPPERKDIKWTRQSVRLYDGHVVPGIDPMERKYYWITGSPLEAGEENTDRWAIENDYVSIMPLRLDLTDKAELEKRKHNQ
ncbi:hypothetical protein ACFSOV_22755 [Pedobacter petrophilus]|uniref:hypothetical protein n=1 Tax=Pedobacter petrophilus TaxID=1908241 RepID=UPI001ADF23C5